MLHISHHTGQNYAIDTVSLCCNLLRVQVVPHPQCVVAVTITGSRENSTGQEFFFNGIAVVPVSPHTAILRIDRLAKTVFGL
jgi:hypothetical protein